MITQEQLDQLRDLGYSVDVAYMVPNDPNDASSPRETPMYFAARGNVTHFFSEEDAVAALIEQGDEDA